MLKADTPEIWGQSHLSEESFSGTMVARHDLHCFVGRNTETGKSKQSRRTKRCSMNVESQYWRQMLTQPDKAIDLSLRLKPGGASF